MTRRALAARLLDIRDDVAVDFCLLLGFFLSLSVGSFLAEHLFRDALLFGRYPKSWLFDAGDIGLVSCFTYRSCRRLLESK